MQNEKKAGSRPPYRLIGEREGVPPSYRRIHRSCFLRHRRGGAHSFLPSASRARALLGSLRSCSFSRPFPFAASLSPASFRGLVNGLLLRLSVFVRCRGVLGGETLENPIRVCAAAKPARRRRKKGVSHHSKRAKGEWEEREKKEKEIPRITKTTKQKGQHERGKKGKKKTERDK